MREQKVDLKLISGDARETVRRSPARSACPPTPASSKARSCPRTPAGLAEAAERNTIFCRIAPEQKKALVGGAARVGALHGDDRRRRQRRAGAEAGAARGGDGLRRPGDQRRGRRRPARGRVLAAARSGRRRAADRPQHPPPRAPLPDQDRLRGDADPARRGARLRLPLPAPPPDPGRLPDDRHPLLRARPGALRRPALPRAADAGAGRLRGAGRASRRRSARSSPSSSSTRCSAARWRRAGPRRRRR